MATGYLDRINSPRNPQMYPVGAIRRGFYLKGRIKSGKLGPVGFWMDYGHAGMPRAGTAVRRGAIFTAGVIC